MTIIIYSPTTDADEEEIDEFDDQGQSQINRTCKQDGLLVIGKWKARVGNNYGGKC